jgi:hypothetical protein
MGTHHSQRIDNDNRYKFVVNQKLLETNYSWTEQYSKTTSQQRRQDSSIGKGN